MNFTSVAQHSSGATGRAGGYGNSGRHHSLSLNARGEPTTGTWRGNATA